MRKPSRDTKHHGEFGRWKQVAPASRGASDTLLPITWQATPEPSTRLRAAVSVPAVVGVAAFVLAVACTAWFVLQGLVGDAGAVETAQGSIATGAADTGTDAPADLLTAQSTDMSLHGEEVVFVHVVGEAIRPGVVKLQLGSRVTDALDAAGGVTPAALLDEMNLARKVVDGERIVVPNAQTLEQLPEFQQSNPAEVAGATGGLLNVNAAAASAFESLPGIGPVIAARIVAWREANGPFAAVDQLTEVSGISARTLEGFRDLVTV